MTLVLTAATTDWVFQVSDRRLTYYDPVAGEAVKRDDYRNKAVMLAGGIVLSFTGLAELGQRSRTDLWLAEVLAELDAGRSQDPQSVAYVRQIGHAIAEAADLELARAKWARLSAIHRRLSFVVAGWARSESGELRPYIGRLSNYEDGRKSFDEAKRDWTFQGGVLQKDLAGRLVSVGVPLTHEEEGKLIADLRDEDSFGGSPDRMVFLMGEAIRAVSVRNDDVGRGLLIATIPRSAAERPEGLALTLAGGPMEGAPTFLYVPRESTTGISYGPTFAAGGMVISDFTIREVSPPGESEGKR